MSHLFRVLVNGKIEEYDNFDDIPDKIDNVIAFLPEIIPPPHKPGEHEINAQWGEKFKELMSRETK